MNVSTDLSRRGTEYGLESIFFFMMIGSNVSFLSESKL